MCVGVSVVNEHIEIVSIKETLNFRAYRPPPSSSSPGRRCPSPHDFGERRSDGGPGFVKVNRGIVKVNRGIDLFRKLKIEVNVSCL